jgi:hypothetical protein
MRAGLEDLKSGRRAGLEDINGVVGDAMWKNSGVSRGLFSSPSRNEVFGFGGPVLADVEKQISGAKSMSKRKSNSAQSVGADVEADCREKSGEKREEEDLFLQGKRKRREVGGDLKNKNCDDNVGSGMAEAAEQPRRPQ